jgi:predicted AlkP superfamily pyrophosphatase or phosphodiesterase
MIRMPRASLAAALVTLLCAPPAPAAAAVERPRLVVVVSIDQFRADYLTRFEDLYLPPGSLAKPGGFRFLMERGAFHVDAHHDHFPIQTGPGHAVILTGSAPYKSGIISNDWYNRVAKDPKNPDKPGKNWYCVEDPDSPLIGASPGEKLGISPRNLRVSTLGDELKMATGGQAKVWGVALKDRASVLMAGAMADGALWIDENTGRWITSKFYRPDGTLPRWVADWNDSKPLDKHLGTQWTLTVPESALARVYSKGNKHSGNPSALGITFPKTINGGLTAPGPNFYKAVAHTPLANEFVFETARLLMKEEGLGRDAVPDILAINLSTNDYVGHAYGPNSLEVMDLAVRTDRALSDFFRHLASTVPGGLKNVTLVLTADHGIAPIALEIKDAKLTGGPFADTNLAKARAALNRELGEGDWVSASVAFNIYLNQEALRAASIPSTRAEEIVARALADAPGIHSAYTRTQILEGRLPRTDIGLRLSRAFNPKVSGDVLVVTESHWIPTLTGKGATHFAPYTYDTQVPVALAGFGVKAGTHRQRVSTMDIAPTLADILGILPPSGSEGRVLGEARK